MTQSLFPLIAVSVFALIHYIAYAIFSRVFPPTARAVLKIFLWSNLFMVFGYLLSFRFLSVPPALYFLFSLSIGMGFILFVSSIFLAIFLLLLRLPWNVGRREALRRGFGYAGALFVGGYTAAALTEAHLPPCLVNVKLKFPHLIRAFKAVQLSDIHIGGLIEEHYIRALVERVNALGADCIFLTGDIADMDADRIATPLSLLGELKARYGVYFVTGNHEFFHGVEKTMERLRALGIIVLENEHRTISELGLNIIGVHDLFGRRAGYLKPDLPGAMRGIDARFPTILLAHQPKFAPEALSYPIDLILCGHTHGGQIAPFGIFVKLDQKYLRGLYQLNDKTTLYVNPGTGFWGPPMRLLARAEITLFEIKPKRS